MAGKELVNRRSDFIRKGSVCRHRLDRLTEACIIVVGAHECNLYAKCAHKATLICEEMCAECSQSLRMGETTTSCRIGGATNTRLKTVLEKSKLSKDQFVDFLITEALDQIDEDEVSYEPLRIVLTVRRELGKPVGETLQSRLTSLSNMLSKQVPETPVSTPSAETSKKRSAPKENPEALLHELVTKLQQNPRVAGAIATLLDLTRP